MSQSSAAKCGLPGEEGLQNNFYTGQEITCSIGIHGSLVLL